MNSTLQRKYSDLEPSGEKISRQQSLLLQLGNPGDLGINVAIADTILRRPLMFFKRPRKGELGQV